MTLIPLPLESHMGITGGDQCSLLSRASLTSASHVMGCASSGMTSLLQIVTTAACLVWGST